MKSQARVVVIGGGIVGVSVAYHLAKFGWTDVALIEKHDLTTGSTWHAAGLLPLFNMSYSVGQIHKYSVDLYQKLEAETGQAVGFRKAGNLRLALNQERLDEFRRYSGTANTIGVPFELVGPSEIKKLWPLAYTKDVVGGLFHPHDGYIAPVDVTQALAKGARMNGVEINLRTSVTAIRQAKNGEWVVSTDKGDITCEVVVSATGCYAAETMAMVGIRIPVINMEHQYIVTETIPEFAEWNRSGNPLLPVLRDTAGSNYIMQEADGLNIGFYEKGAPPWALDGVPKGFESELLTGALDRLEPYLIKLAKRVPAFEHAELKNVVNGPIAYGPDGNPLVGPAPGLRNFFISEGHTFGITAAGGSGKHLAEWIIQGYPEIDMSALDPRRYSKEECGKDYTVTKSREAYEHVYIVHYDFEERPAGRPLKKSTLYERLKEQRAAFGQAYGWDRPNWFAPEGVEPKNRYSFHTRRTNWFDIVGEEVKAVRRGVGVLDFSYFGKHEVSGPGAAAYVDSLVSNRLPKVGGIRLAYALTPAGGVRSEFTITRESEDSFYLVSPSIGLRHNEDLLLKALPDDGSVTLKDVTHETGALMLNGPRSAEVLARICDADFSAKGFPWLSARRITAAGIPVRALHVSYAGELGWELHAPIDRLPELYDALMEAGKEFGIVNYGVYALNAMRIEKSYRAWRSELTEEYNLLEAGLDRLVDFNKQFVGREALLAKKEKGLSRRLVTLEVEIDDSDPLGNEPVYEYGELVGRVTSGSYGYSVGKSLALAYVKTGADAIDNDLAVEILGKLCPARVIADSPHDPENSRMKASRVAAA